MDSIARPIPSVDPAEAGDRSAEPDSAIVDLLEGLERAPEESWNAFQGLESLDPDVRGPIVQELLTARASEGLTRLLHLLGASRDDAVREAVREALGTNRRPIGASPQSEPTPGTDDGPVMAKAPDSTPEPEPGPGRATLLVAVDRDPPRLIRTLATGVDGEGLGAVVVTSIRGGRTSTATFLCDVRAGARDVLGTTDGPLEADVDPFDQIPQLESVPYLEDAHGLAAGLLAGSLMLSGRDTPAAVRGWLDVTLGPGFHARAFLAARPEWAAGPADAATLADRSWRVLNACSTWVDRSPLTYDLAEEINVRERRAAADPLRDAGAYRYLFERRILHRLELYRRMLLWMAFFWDAAGEARLATAAGSLSGQLADPQYAVPSNPFTVALSTRSLHEAQRLLGTASDPRRS